MAETRVVRTEIPGLDPRVLVFRYGNVVDSFALLTLRFTVIVDTMINPETAGQVWEFTRAEAREGAIPLVVNTHGDWDHAWGNSFFDGPTATVRAPILGHPAFRRAIAWDEAQSHLDRMRQEEPGAYDEVAIRLPTVEMESGLIHGGDLTVELIPTPGHTEDHLALWVPELALLIAGDAAEMPIPFISGRSDVSLLRASLHRMQKLGARTVLYSHGGGFVTPDLIDANISYFDEAERRCREHLASGRPQAVTPESLSWRLDDTLPPGSVLGPEERAFYERSHARALAAVSEWLVRQAC